MFSTMIYYEHHRWLFSFCFLLGVYTGYHSKTPSPKQTTNNMAEQFHIVETHTLTPGGDKLNSLPSLARTIHKRISKDKFQSIWYLVTWLEAIYIFWSFNRNDLQIIEATEQQTGGKNYNDNGSVSDDYCWMVTDGEGTAGDIVGPPLHIQQSFEEGKHDKLFIRPYLLNSIFPSNIDGRFISRKRSATEREVFPT